jgi:hypothetical protein
MDELGIIIKGLHGIPSNNIDLSIYNDKNMGPSDDPVYARLVATRDIISEYPESIAPFEDPQRFLQELEYAINNWNTPNRDQALKILAQREKQLDDIQPLNGLMEDVGEDMEDMTDNQVEAMVDLLSGGADSLEGINSGEDLGRALLAKDKRLREKQYRLSRKLKSTPRRNHKNISRRIKSISRLRNRIRQINRLDRNGKNKVARVIAHTYRSRPKPEIREERVDEPINTTYKSKKTPNDYGISENSSGQDFLYQNDFTENFIEPEIEYIAESQDEYPVMPTSYSDSDTYENDPYDDWLELVEDYLDDMEDIEDDITLQELQELNGLGNVELGAFWHKRKKRLEKKQKRQEKRLKKAEKKNKTKRIEQLKLSLQKNKLKQKDGGNWKRVRKDWRKENKRGFWQGIQRTGQGAVNALVKYNPLSIAARNGFLAALKLNVKKMSSRLKWGYATKEQALKHGMSIGRWLHTKKALAKVEDLFVNKTKGSKKALKKAIIKGGKGLSGMEMDGMGAVPLAVVAAAATPLIIAVVKILQSSGIMDPNVKLEKVEEDLKKGNFENNNDIPPTEFDEIELDIQQPWYQKKEVKVAGVIGGGVLLLGVGYLALRNNKKQLPAAKKEIPAQLSGNSSAKSKSGSQKKESKTEPKKEPIKEITLT